MDSWVDDGSSSRALAQSGKGYLVFYVELRNMSDGDLSWRLYPKHHLFGDLAAEAKANPKLTWSYALESEIGDATVVAAGCNKHNLRTALLQRYVDSK